MESITLYDLNTLVRTTLEEHLPEEVWVQAELSEVRVASNGHCYVEFVQKDKRGNGLVAKARGIIWRQDWNLIQPLFERTTGQAFTAGLKVLVQVTVTFHELYGYSLTVTDIDPTYTLGDLARRRKEILDRLEREGVLTLNKELTLPALVLRVAVISSATAAGYGDFCNQLEQNGARFAFRTQLFPAIMQGDQVEKSIVEALNAIADEIEEWDVVVIIRGGGSTSDLSGFDTYNLANNCAQFPLPIITGIGHERDDTVIDLVAHTRVKTPTAAAEFLIQHAEEAESRLLDLHKRLAEAIEEKVTAEKKRIVALTDKLPSLFAIFRLKQVHHLDAMLQNLQASSQRSTLTCNSLLSRQMQRIQTASDRRILEQQHRVEMLEQRLATADPALILQRGYSYTLHNGKILKDADSLHPGDKVTTHLAKGQFTSVVEP